MLKLPTSKKNPDGRQNSRDDGRLPTNIYQIRVHDFVNYASTKDSYHLSVSKYQIFEEI